MLQTPLSEGYLGAFPSSAKIIKSGPIVWGMPVDMLAQERGKLFKKIFNGRGDFSKTRVILHAATPKSSYSLRFQVYETPDEYVRSIYELASAVEKIPNAVLIIKFRAQREISQSELEADDLRALIPFSKKVILIANESFTDLLGISDLLVSFSSTTIEESLQNRIPVLLYGGAGRYEHILAEELNPDRPLRKSALYHVKEEKYLEYAIGRILGLDIKRNKDGYLFDPYIYTQDDRVSLVELLRADLKRERAN